MNSMQAGALFSGPTQRRERERLVFGRGRSTDPEGLGCMSIAQRISRIFCGPCLLTGSRIQTAGGPDAATRDEKLPAGQHSEGGLDSRCGIFRCRDRTYPFPRPHSPSQYRTSGTEALLSITRYESLPELKRK